MPPLLILPKMDDYYDQYVCNLANSNIVTCHGVRVYFNRSKKHFKHSFFESTQHDRNKNVFSRVRAERMDWIKPTLTDHNANWYQGWMNKEYVIDRSVAVARGSFVVVLKYKASGGSLAANFVTCFVADNSMDKIRTSPSWDIDNCKIYLGIKNGR